MNAQVILLEPIRILDQVSAEKYGRIVYLFEDGRPRASFWSDEFKMQLLARLEEVNYHPMVDYFMASGAIAPLSIALCTIVAEYGPTRLLIYHAVKRDYWQKVVGDANYVRE
jgi:hypothetical protein